jgi:hypothetical protein
MSAKNAILIRKSAFISPLVEAGVFCGIWINPINPSSAACSTYGALHR